MSKAKAKIKKRVITFRITEKQETELKQKLTATPIFGMNSENQLCRKVVSDFLSGKLVYTNPKDAALDNDSLDSGALPA